MLVHTGALPSHTHSLLLADVCPPASIGDSSADVEVEFSGVQPAVSSFDSAITVEAKQGYARVDVSAPHGAAAQLLTPKVRLGRARQTPRKEHDARTGARATRRLAFWNAKRGLF